MLCNIQLICKLNFFNCITKLYVLLSITSLSLFIVTFIRSLYSIFYTYFTNTRIVNTIFPFYTSNYFHYNYENDTCLMYFLNQQTISFMLIDRSHHGTLQINFYTDSRWRMFRFKCNIRIRFELVTKLQVRRSNNL